MCDCCSSLSHSELRQPKRKLLFPCLVSKVSVWVGAETSEYGIGMDGKTIGLRAQDDSGHGIVSPAGYETRLYDKGALSFDMVAQQAPHGLVQFQSFTSSNGKSPRARRD